MEWTALEPHWPLGRAADWLVERGLSPDRKAALLVIKTHGKGITGCRCWWADSKEPREVDERETLEEFALVDLDFLPVPGTEEYAALPAGYQLIGQEAVKRQPTDLGSVYLGGSAPEILICDGSGTFVHSADGWCRLRVSSVEVQASLLTRVPNAIKPKSNSGRPPSKRERAKQEIRRLMSEGKLLGNEKQETLAGLLNTSRGTAIAALKEVQADMSEINS
jgi:hypothetical protein